MKQFLQWLVWGFFGATALTIVFVKAGQKGGTSGGAQTSMIFQSGSAGLASVATALEGGN